LPIFRAAAGKARQEDGGQSGRQDGGKTGNGRKGRQESSQKDRCQGKQNRHEVSGEKGGEDRAGSARHRDAGLRRRPTVLKRRTWQETATCSAAAGHVLSRTPVPSGIGKLPVRK